MNNHPIVLVHGIMLKDFWRFKAFGKIEKQLNKAGYRAFTADHDGLGTTENNAVQIKAFIERKLEETHSEKVHIIAHSKGGLDALYMIDRLGMADKVSSITFICTPHKGSVIASKLYDLPKIIRAPMAWWCNVVYRIFGDKHPDALKVCEALRRNPHFIVSIENEETQNVFMQSFSSTLKHSKDDFVMGIPLFFSRRLEKCDSDGMVSLDSSQFGEYRGDCLDESISHSEIVDFLARKKKSERVVQFYLKLAEELALR